MPLAQSRPPYFVVVELLSNDISRSLLVSHLASSVPVCGDKYGYRLDNLRRGSKTDIRKDKALTYNSFMFDCDIDDAWCCVYPRPRYMATISAAAGHMEKLMRKGWKQGKWLKENVPGSVVMYREPGGVCFYSEGKVIQIPLEDLDRIIMVMKFYKVTHIIPYAIPGPFEESIPSWVLRPATKPLVEGEMARIQTGL